MFKITVEKFNGNILEELEFDTREEAKKQVKIIAKKYGATKHSYHLVNYKNLLEVCCNF